MENLLSIIGPPRCGSTWLHNSLRAHSRFRCAAGRVKEVGYFDAVHPGPLASDRLGAEQARAYAVGKGRRADKLRSRIATIDQILATLGGSGSPGVSRLTKEKTRLADFTGNFATGTDWYRRQFDIDQAGLWGLDSTPAYCLMAKEGYAELLGVADRVIYVLLTRDAEGMLRSRLQHHAYKPSTRSPLLPADAQARLLTFFARSYALSLRQALAHVPEESLRIVAFEDLIGRPERTVTDLLGSIDLQAEPACWSQIGVSPNPSRPIDIAPEAEALLGSLAAHLDEDSRRLLGRGDALPRHAMP